MGVKIDLSGEWQFDLDSAQIGIARNFFSKDLTDTITLPSTTSASKKGELNTARETGYLTDSYKFEGYAWYAKEITLHDEVISQESHHKVVLKLERTRKSYVWVDDHYIGCETSFCTSHMHDLTPYITKKHHKLTIMVSNMDYRAAGGHMTSPDTQTNWNGILGEIALEIFNGVQIEDLQVTTSIKEQLVHGKMQVNSLVALNDAKLVCKIEGKKDFIQAITLVEGNNEVTFDYKLDGPIKLWDEYHTNVYDLEVSIEAEGIKENKTITFGFREFKAEGRQFTINGKKTLLRGKHDGLIFPLTGYAPMDKASWLKVFAIAKEYGINHYRFHTCCPPKAAFEAADESGIYMQPELPFWGTILAPGEEGYNAEMQDFLVEEGYKILKEFGNHPSFVMMSMGNELWGNKAIISKMVADYKKADRRHLYTQGSNNFQFYPTDEPEDDFFSGVRFSRDRLIRGSYAMCDAPQGHIQVMKPNTVYNYDEMIRPEMAEDTGSSEAKMIEIQYGTGVKKVKAESSDEMIPSIPVVSHEVGQYAVFPNFREIDKYTGVLKARNFEVFRERLREKGMLEQADHFFMASGKLAADCYKLELETAFRSKELAGFQLLDLQDFSGQGTALVGMLDAFLDNKGLIEADKWRNFCSDAVLLAELEQFTFVDSEVVTTKVKLCYYRDQVLNGKVLEIALVDEKGKRIGSKAVELKEVKAQALSELTTFKFTLPKVHKPECVTLKLAIEETDIQNEYVLWVFPRQVPHIDDRDIVTTESFEVMRKALAQGKKVLFVPKVQKQSIKGTYCTDFWCYPMFRSISESMNREVPIGTMGLFIQNTHPALGDFVSEFYTTPQWWEVVEEADCTVLDQVPIKPIVQMIDNFERNHRLGIIYEMQVGKGKVMVCTSQVIQGEKIEGKWLKYSLTKYMMSEEFKPKCQMTMAELRGLFSV